MALPVYASPLERLWHYTYLVICALILLFLIAPIIIVIPLSFNAEPYFTFTEKMLHFDPSGYSMRWYDKLVTFGMQNPEAERGAAFWWDFWHNATWMQVTKNSIIIGVCATLLSAGLGTVAALGLTRPEMPFRKQITAVLISPMIVPIIISATGMFFFYSGQWLPIISLSGGVHMEWGRLAGTYAGIILAHAALGIPFVIITVTATLSGFDQSLVRAAASLGANPRTAFFRVVMPLILPGVVSGGLFAFVTSFDEVVAVLFIANHDQQTIPRQMWNGIREQISPAILAVATILVVISIALLATVELLRRRSERLRGLSPR
ncbi:ABC transporter permease [Sinirhodobacter ferrireducens]|uniref:ABC transporter permease n=1 Tax=Paenirhodobacter ferrireducens TaxID=1215032 RepID=A0A443LRU7_9RHOB|nr:ABC transporter permease [Sinirhodobacter ferrireducens]RWR51897.1 ABC transporter permease [Sinirhodobacter ferrireducens]